MDQQNTRRDRARQIVEAMAEQLGDPSITYQDPGPPPPDEPQNGRRLPHTDSRAWALREENRELSAELARAERTPDERVDDALARMALVDDRELARRKTERARAHRDDQLDRIAEALDLDLGA